MRRAEVVNPEIAVVVGASGALGSAIAERLRAEGLTVVAVARTAADGVCVADIGADTAVAAIADG
ncbi:MAG: NAD-dependent epimerase/dehydratase family protein, partial [Pseudonocardia sp.]|nr:NAD-dependent epimerase/dehydratase family protein [Pseudonocardia sp.]